MRVRGGVVLVVALLAGVMSSSPVAVAQPGGGSSSSVWVYSGFSNDRTPLEFSFASPVRKVTNEGEPGVLLEDGSLFFVPQRNDFGDQPVRFFGVPAFVDFDGTADRGVGLTAAGDVWSWGDNNGRPGSGTDRSPGRMSFPLPISQVDADGFAVASDGTVFGWGANVNGINDGSLVPTTVAQPAVEVESPVLIPGLSDIVAVSAGRTSAAALTGSGEVLTWGSAARCVLGRLGPNGCSAVSGNVAAIGPITELDDIVDIGLQANWGYAVDDVGRVHVWGFLPERGESPPAQIPTRLPGFSNVEDVVGLLSGLAVLDDGSVFLNDPNITGSFTDFVELPFVGVTGLASTGGSSFFGGVVIGGDNDDGGGVDSGNGGRGHDFCNVEQATRCE